jgi:hypothetical protein
MKPVMMRMVVVLPAPFGESSFTSKKASPINSTCLEDVEKFSGKRRELLQLSQTIDPSGNSKRERCVAGFSLST